MNFQFFQKRGNLYKEYADIILKNLTESYMVPLNQMHGFLLQSSTGHKPGGTEIEVPIVYADYYFLEALIRKKESSRIVKAPILFQKRILL